MDESFELRDLVAIINRQRRLIGYLFCLAVGIALIINNVVPPVYEASATMRVKLSRQGNDQYATWSEEQMKQQINTFAEILKSRVVVETVIDKEYSDSVRKPTYEEIARSIDAQQVPNTEMLKISVQMQSQPEAQKIANALVESFNERMTEIVRFENKQARVVLSDSLDEARRGLDKAERALVEYKTTKGAVAATSQTNLFLEKQSVLARQKADNQLAMASSQARLGSINRLLSRQTPELFADNPLIQQYKSRLAEQETELVALRKSMTVAHPKVVALQAAIESTKAGLQTEIAKVVNLQSGSSNPLYQGLVQNQVQAEVDVAVASVQRGVLDQQSAEEKRELSQLPAREQGLARLQLDYSLAESTYITVAKRYDEMRITEMTQPTNIQLVDRAALPERPIAPRRLINLLVAAVLGLFAGVSVAFIADYFYKTVDTVEDMRRYLGVPVMGSIPSYSRASRRSKSSWGSFWSDLMPSRKNKHRRFRHASA